MKPQHRLGRNGTSTPKASIKTTQKSPTDQMLRSCYIIQDKLSSPMKQEIRTMYRLKLDTDSKHSEGDNNNGNQNQPATSSPMASSNTQGFNGSPQSNSVKRKLTYLSERQSEMSPMIGVPNPPPCTPNNTGIDKQELTHCTCFIFKP